MSESRANIPHLKNDHKLEKLKSVITFDDPELLQSHFMVFLALTETKLLDKKPPHLYELKILGFYPRVPRPSREFRLPLWTVVELCSDTCHGQPSEAVFLH